MFFIVLSLNHLISNTPIHTIANFIACQRYWFGSYWVKELLMMYFIACMSLSPILVQAACMTAGVIESKPIGYVNQSGEKTGVHWDFLQEISQETGLCIDQKLMPFARVWQGLEAGSHDLTVGFSSPSRDGNVIKVGLIRELKTIVVGADGFNVRSYEDLIGLRIGKTRSTKLDNRFDQDKSLDIVDLNNYQQGATMLFAGRIDALAGSFKAISYQLAQEGQHRYLDIHGFHVLGVKQQWLHMSKLSEYQQVIPELKQAVLTLQQEGTLKQLIDKHYQANK